MVARLATSATPVVPVCFQSAAPAPVFPVCAIRQALGVESLRAPTPRSRRYTALEPVAVGCVSPTATCASASLLSQRRGAVLRAAHLSSARASRRSFSSALRAFETLSCAARARCWDRSPCLDAPGRRVHPRAAPPRRAAPFLARSRLTDASRSSRGSPCALSCLRAGGPFIGERRRAGPSPLLDMTHHVVAHGCRLKK